MTKLWPHFKYDKWFNIANGKGEFVKNLKQFINRNHSTTHIQLKVFQNT